jgi:hypothetical protein
MHCRQKGEKFNELLLRPDSDDYEFDRYFRWDFTLGTIEVNAKATEDEQRRAEVTRTLYGLNIGHPVFAESLAAPMGKARERAARFDALSPLFGEPDSNHVTIL